METLLSSPLPIELSTLKKVNRAVNATPYVPEVIEDWSSHDLTGKDCDSYATRKFELLAEAGWPKSMLRLATCNTETEGYHAVLLVDLEEQTWVLDNRYEYPMEYQILDYVWIKGQIPETNQFEGLKNEKAISWIRKRI